MSVISARYDENGNIIAVINAVEWHGITPKSRFYEMVMEWVAAGNVIAPFIV